MPSFRRKLLPTDLKVENAHHSDEIDSDSFCADYGCTSIRNGDCGLVCLDNCTDKCPLDIPPPPPIINQHSEDTKKIAILTASILFSVFVLAFLIIKYTNLCSRCRLRSSSRSIQEPRTTNEEFLDEEHGPIVDHPIWYIRTVGLDPAVINSIAVCRFKKGDGLVEGTDCSVCLSEFEEDETLRLLPKCSHAFHLTCIDTWLRSHTNCPLCRAPILSGASAATPPSSSSDGTLNPDVALAEENEEYRRETVNPYVEIEIDVGERRENQENDEENDAISDMQVRRSFSFDCLSAPNFNLEIPNQGKSNSDSSDARREKGLESSNSSRSLGRNSLPIFLRRSFSCSGKALVTRHSRNR